MSFLGSSELCALALVSARFLLNARDRLLEGLHVGEDQFGIYGLHVFRRRHTAFDMHDVVILECAQHLADRIGLANVREELVAETGTLARALHDAGDVDEGHRSRKLALGTEDLGQLSEAGIRNADHTGVGLDGRERVVRGEHVVLGQRVEER